MHANCTGCLKNGANQMHMICTCTGIYLTRLQPDLCDTDMLTLNTPSPDPSLLGGMVNIILLHGMRSARGNGIGCLGSVLPATKANISCSTGIFLVHSLNIWQTKCPSYCKMILWS